MISFAGFLRDIDKRVWWIIAVAAVLIFFRFTHVDMTGDDAHYSVRAIGLADFMFGDAPFQSTPLAWYKTVPWWASLSFHDHPKLLFIIQHIFLSIDDTVFFAKLPYALFSILSIFLIYFLVKKISGNQEAGVIAALLLALNSHFIWAGRVSYMEGGVIFFTLLALLAFVRFMDEPRLWWQFGIAFGLALSVKFTTLFLVPTFALYIVIANRRRFASKELWLAIAVAIVIISPIIIYNASMYLDRGHFSLQFARLLGQKSPWNFSGISNDYANSFGGLFINLGGLASWPFFSVFILSFAHILFIERRVTLCLCAALFSTIQQLFIGQNGYVLAPFSIIIACVISEAYSDALNRFARKKKIISAIKYGGVAGAAYLLIFAINSHILVRHFGQIGFAHSSATSDNYGVAQLDSYINRLVPTLQMGKHDIFNYVKKPGSGVEKYLANVPSYELKEQLKHSTIILYDGNISWFSRVWLFERRRFYKNQPFISTNEQHLLNEVSVRDLYLIRATDSAPLDPKDNQNGKAASLEENLFVKRGIEPELIYRDDGRVAFKVYHADSKSLQSI